SAGVLIAPARGVRGCDALKQSGGAAESPLPYASAGLRKRGGAGGLLGPSPPRFAGAGGTIRVLPTHPPRPWRGPWWARGAGAEGVVRVLIGGARPPIARNETSSGVAVARVASVSRRPSAATRTILSSRAVSSATRSTLALREAGAIAISRSSTRTRAIGAFALKRSE